MEERDWWSLKQALLDVGGSSQICWHWEIDKLLFLLHNINPVWMEVNTIMDENFDKVDIISFALLAKLLQLPKLSQIGNGGDL